MTSGTKDETSTLRKGEMRSLVNAHARTVTYSTRHDHIRDPAHGTQERGAKAGIKGPERPYASDQIKFKTVPYKSSTKIVPLKITRPRKVARRENF